MVSENQFRFFGQCVLSRLLKQSRNQSKRSRQNSMRGFIKRILGTKVAPPFDIEKAVGQYLLELPRCPAKVIIAGPCYKDPHYLGEVIVDAAGLLPWTEHHASAVSGFGKTEAARQALPIWLRGADGNDPGPAALPPLFVEVLRPYALDFINKEIAEVICPECHTIVTEIERLKFDEGRIVDWSWWTEEWRCSQGHLLYRAEQEIHFFIRR